MGRFAVILPAAGRSTRFGDAKQKKTFAELDGRAVWLRAAEVFLSREDVEQVIVAISPDDHEMFDRRYGPEIIFRGIEVVDGGDERSDTIARALQAVDSICNYVAVHDAARPCISADRVDAVFAAALQHGAAILGVAVADTLKRVGADRKISETVPRAGLYAAQTPQVFRKDWLIEAYANREKQGGSITDDAQLLEAIGHPCAVVEGSPMNIKITTPADLKLASAILKSMPKLDKATPLHPFSNEMAKPRQEPKRNLEDLF